jgi:hypothetical protein
MIAVDSPAVQTAGKAGDGITGYNRRRYVSPSVGRQLFRSANRVLAFTLTGKW